MSIGKGLFVAIEGIEGAGTSTQTKLLADFFEISKKNHIVLTREPANSKAMIKIREMLKSGTDPYKNGELYAELFVEDRKDHVKNLIKPALKYGALVFSDRYDLSTYAYQQLQGVPFEKLRQMHKGVLVPDLSIIVDVPAELGQGRITDKEDFDDLSFQKELRKKYLELPDLLKDREIVIVNGTKSIDSVYDKIKELVLYKK